MTLQIVWGQAALAALYALDPDEAMAVDRAVLRFARTRRGSTDRIGPHYRLRVATFQVRFSITRDPDTMNVLYLYPMR